MIGFAKTVENKKLSGQGIITELQNELHPKEEAVKKKTIGALLDNIWPIARSFLPGESLYGVKVPDTSPPTPKAPASRKDYFDGMKKANPNATEEQINKYLDGKGIK